MNCELQAGEIEGNDGSRGFPSRHLSRRLAELPPAYFALVMATGIVSLGCNSFGLTHVSRILFLVNVVAYVVLAGLFLARARFFLEQFVSDLSSHSRAFGFFTMVAATNVLGCQFYQLAGNVELAKFLWWVGLVLWLVCTYTIFILLVVKAEKPTLESGINGGWLTSVVATQSVCVLGSQLEPAFGNADLTALFLLSFWLFGGMLYIWLISLIFYRYMFFSFQPGDLIPPYWINMGAMAITTLAGAELVIHFSQISPVSTLVSFVKGLSVMYWATATWWIPMLLALGFWRHGVRKFQFKYDPLYWGLVFPLGMYSVCTLKLGRVLEIGDIKTLAHGFLILGLTAWMVTFLSMLQRPLFALLLGLQATRSRNSEKQEDDSHGTSKAVSG